MAHAAVKAKAERYQTQHFMIRSRLFKGLQVGQMQLGPLADEERLKMILPQACYYCASRQFLTVDHLISTSRGGENCGENIVWACRSCNSSKGARDALVWIAGRGAFPPLLLLRRYLKIAVGLSQEREVMHVPIANPPLMPFLFEAIPLSYPPPKTLCLWITDRDAAATADG